jgi:hypothetical protein
MPGSNATRHLVFVLLTLTVFACGAVRSADQPISWSEAEDWSVHIVTRDEDGRARVTRIWLVIVDGSGVIRTGQSRWWKNLDRGSPCHIRLGGSRGVEYAVSTDEITDAAERARVNEAFAAKYGWQEQLFIPSDRASSGDHYLRLAAVAD